MTPPAPSEALARIRAMVGRLVASERRVAEVVLADPERVLGWSVADVAEAASTSTATVVRACQRFGFTGFPQLRMVLARELPGIAAAPDRTTVAGIFATAIESLRLSADMVDQRQVDRAVMALASARRRLFVGTGASAAPVQDAALRFICSGWPTEAPADGVTQSLTARLLSADDVCLAVSHSGANQPTLDTVAAAREAGATTIGISSYPDSALARLVDIPLIAGLVTGSDGVDVVTGRISHLLLLHALQVSVAGTDPAATSVAQGKVLGVLKGIAAESPRDERSSWTL
ncbi:MurR/RpiR family transcriptional regulator [Nakamurella leprariae]|uniref:MurR/RpiR family transcriptional regulator n=1 Tax=Nakamurella leprariae TaxID=2803911 RepID=A0A939C393_9ACTN|nr:MurR/RpiR family transcriptional regulator [Nakamurella leprariae]MBM9468867.1 MurR/RpiR family transcriptional regulator [Nakamurella leprariae]